MKKLISIYFIFNCPKCDSIMQQIIPFDLECEICGFTCDIKEYNKITNHFPPSELVFQEDNNEIP